MITNKIKKRIQDISEIATSSGVTFVGSFLSDSLIGQIAPGAITAIMGYRQKRFEHMILLTIDETEKRLDIFQGLVNQFSDPNFIREKGTSSYVGFCS
jgi:hypothetical protein